VAAVRLLLSHLPLPFPWFLCFSLYSVSGCAQIMERELGPGAVRLFSGVYTPNLDQTAGKDLTLASPAPLLLGCPRMRYISFLSSLANQVTKLE
jgi:hypothetical protein